MTHHHFKLSALGFLAALGAATLLVLASCATTPTAQQRYITVIDPLQKPQTLAVSNMTIIDGSHNFQSGPAQVQLTLTNTLSTPLQVRWGDSQIENAGNRSGLFVRSQHNAGETPMSVVLLGKDTLTDRIIPTGNVRFAALSDFTFLGASTYSYVPMQPGPIQLYLVYNDTPGFAGTNKAITITFTPEAPPTAPALK